MMVGHRVADVYATSDMFDVGPCRVEGGLTAPRARVLWSDGVLFVARSPRNVIAASAIDEPVIADGGWTVTLDSGEVVTFTQKGCPRCGYQETRNAKAAALVEKGLHWLAHHPQRRVAL